MTSTSATAPDRPGLVSLLGLSAWCGLVAGLLEVAAIVTRKQLFHSNHLYGMSRHFVWIVPTANLCVFLALGVLACALVLPWTWRGRGLFVRRVVRADLAADVVGRVSTGVWRSLACRGSRSGRAARPRVRAARRAFRRIVQISFPVALGAVAIMAAWPLVGDQIKQSRENARPLPLSGSPNVLLIVMDTVAAGHLSLHGYERATSKSLAELAGQGIQFDSVQAASSWTLPSHAAMLTGRWMHELSVGWLTPLDGKPLTLAEYLGSNGYATAGFVANTSYCARDSGLDRGFTEYRDFIFPGLTALKQSVLVNCALAGIQTAVDFLQDQLGIARVPAYIHRLADLFAGSRKSAATANHELLEWLSERARPERPFFAFVNYLDAHYPYQLPAGHYHRFGGTPADSRQRAMIDHWWDLDKTTLSPQELAFAASAYDDCVADPDEQIGWLVDRLGKLGFLRIPGWSSPRIMVRALASTPAFSATA